jgi:hypothetical protein
VKSRGDLQEYHILLRVLNIDISTTFEKSLAERRLSEKWKVTHLAVLFVVTSRYVLIHLVLGILLYQWTYLNIVLDYSSLRYIDVKIGIDLPNHTASLTIRQ